MLVFLKQQWWKWLSIGLLTAAFFGGLFIPLAPGISKVEPETAPAGSSVEFKIFTTNTDFQNTSVLPKTFLQAEGKILYCATQTQIVSEKEIRAYFDIPFSKDTLTKGNYFNLVIQDENAGTFFLRKAVFVQNNFAENVQNKNLDCTTILQILKPKGLSFPHREILYESIRNLFFHVPMWFAMILLLSFSFAASIKYLTTRSERYDVIATSFSAVGLWFGLLGITTGMQWANFTWGAPWINDPKLNGAVVGMLIYMAYFILRGSLENQQSKARISAVYSIFAYVLFIVFIYVLPRLSDSLHPGSGGNPGFNMYDLDNTMRPVFYAAVLGFSGLGYWAAAALTRIQLIALNYEDENM